MKMRTWPACCVAIVLNCWAFALAAEDIPWVCRTEDHPATVQSTKAVALVSSAEDFDATWWCSAASGATALNLLCPGFCLFFW